MTNKNVRIVKDLLIVFGFIIMLASNMFGIICTIIGALIMTFSFILDFLYNKCPHCKKRLYRNEEPFCHYCGRKINE